MDEPVNQIEGDSANQLLKRFVLEQDEAAYAQLCSNLRPRLLAALKSGFASLPEQCREDIVQNVFLKLYAEPAKAWNPNSARPANAFPILCRHATYLALDLVRKTKQASMIGLDEIAENLSTEPPGKSPSQLPSEAEMEKVIKNAGLNDPLVADLKNPEIWPDGKAKPNYELLAERHQTTVENMQQRVSRYRKQVLKKFGSKAGFLAVAMSTLARFRQSFPSNLAWLFVIASVLAIFLLLKKTTQNATKPIASQNLSATERTNAETNATADVPKQNVDDRQFQSNLATNANIDSFKANPDGVVQGIPDEVVVFYMKFQRKNMDGISAALHQSIKKVSLIEVPVPIISNGLDDGGYVNYNKNSAKDIVDCAKFVQKLITKAEPRYPIPILLSENRPDGQDVKVDEMTWQNAKRTVWVFLP
jgi:DNA-directed RNA polymerase specialized sigma24 family protein